MRVGLEGLGLDAPRQLEQGAACEQRVVAESVKAKTAVFVREKVDVPVLQVGDVCDGGVRRKADREEVRSQHPRVRVQTEELL